MQGSCIASNNAACTAKQRHQWAEFTVIGGCLGVPTRCLHCSDQAFFAGRIVNDTGNSQFLLNSRTKSAEPLRGPALRSPASAGAQHHIAANTLFAQFCPHPSLVCFCNAKRHMTREVG